MLTEKQWKNPRNLQVKLITITFSRLLPNDQLRITEQANYTYSPLGKAFEKQIKTIDGKEEKSRCYYKLKQEQWI